MRNSVADLRSVDIEFSFGPRFQGFQNLMRMRVRDIILVSSLYDLYVFEEDDWLYELIHEEYKGLNLSHNPEFTRVSSGKEALELATESRRFDLIITTSHINDMRATELAERLKEAGVDIPIVLLAFDNREISDVLSGSEKSPFDRVFIWQGDFRILVGIVKHIEDHLNVEHDTSTVGVQVIILVEDNVRYYSSFLPIIYTEIFKQSRRLASESISLSDRYLRIRARPKILLCTNYEDACYYYEKYNHYILGIISDINFNRDGKRDPHAGIRFAEYVKNKQFDIPILLQSNRADNESKAYEVGASFLLKDSPTLLNDLRTFMVDNFGFGDFIFRMPNGKVVGHASNLHSLEKYLLVVPEESIEYHANRNHFSSWLKARTEFWLAHQIKKRTVSEFANLNDMRKLLAGALREYRRIKQRGIITDFNKYSFDVVNGFARIGGGSLGGKARGLTFLNLLINTFLIYNRFDHIRIRVPSAVVLGTDIFDEFMDANHLRHFALSEVNDQEIISRFLAASIFPKTVVKQLKDFLETMNTPLAVRSSSLLEDSQYHPFAGIYETYMLPNNHPNLNIRLQQLLNAIKCVYASTFYKRAKEYIRITSYRLEEEKMAVVIQRMVGATHGERFYPDYAGVARSYNFYPAGPQKANDGIISVALGLGKTVVEGGRSIKFSPQYPNHIPQFADIEGILEHCQYDFHALKLNSEPDGRLESYDEMIQRYPLSIAEKDGTLLKVGSTYSHENNAIYEGLSRVGTRLVTFAPILKSKLFPLPEILELLLQVGREGMGNPVEIEFAVNMSVPKGEPVEFGVLQMRPLVLSRESELLNVEILETENLLCKSNKVLGNGIINDIYDIVAVDYEKFKRNKSQEVAQEVFYFNSKLLKAQRPYLLIGVGRWGSMDPWLGIPVKWEYISGVRAIVETSFKDFEVMPSQGSHFFQNITSFMIGYFTVSSDEENFIDWEWLQQFKAYETLEFTRHLQCESPLIVKMNGHQQKGIIFKPGAHDS